MTEGISRNHRRRRSKANHAVVSGKPVPTLRSLRNDSGDLQPAIRVVMMPRDANYLGTIFGGVILSSLDLAGAVAAHQHSDKKVVTTAMREVKFIAPVFVGDLVSFYTKILKIGHTSISVQVTVEASRAKLPHETVRVTQAEVVYVAVDETGQPVPIRS